MLGSSDCDRLGRAVVCRTNPCWIGDPDRDGSVYIPCHRQAVKLDGTALVAWRMLDGRRTVDQIVDELAARYAGDRAEIRREVMEFILEMERFGLVAWRLRPLLEEVALP